MLTGSPPRFLESCGPPLQDIADCLRDHYGMVVSIFLAGPIPESGGNIGVQSIHAGKTKGVGSEKWPEWSPHEFQSVEKAMLRFADKCYSEFMVHETSKNLPDFNNSCSQSRTRSQIAPEG